MLIFLRDKKRNSQQEFNSCSISLALKIVDTNELSSHFDMGTAGVEPATPENAVTTVFITVYSKD